MEGVGEGGGACLKTPSSNSGIISQDVSEDGCVLGWPWFVVLHVGTWVASSGLS